MAYERSLVVTARGAESFARSNGRAAVSDGELLVAGQALADLYRTAAASGVVRESKGLRILSSGPHVFAFHEDRLHQYIHFYARVDSAATDRQNPAVDGVRKTIHA